MDGTSSIRHARTSRGTTLVESLVVVALLAIVAALALPSWQAHLLQKRLEGAAEAYRQHFQWARSQAIRSGQPVRILFGRDTGGSCYVVFTGPDTACGCTTDGAHCAAPGRLLASEHLPAAQLVAVQPKGNTRRLLVDPLRGTVTPTLTAVFSTPDGRALHEVVNLLGRGHGCSPQGNTPGWPACKTSG
jgi:type IV fimbrial biogenesis protein FimT